MSWVQYIYTLSVVINLDTRIPIAKDIITMIIERLIALESKVFKKK